MRNLYIDFDGVILDTLTLLYAQMNEQRVDITNLEATEHFFVNIDWKKHLKDELIINDSINCIQKIIDSKKFEVSILTHVNSLNEAIEKVKYIRKYFKDITIIPVPKKIHKTQMVHTEGAILVDDYTENLIEWEKEKGIGVRFSPKLSSKGFIVIDKLDKLLEIDFEKVSKN